VAQQAVGINTSGGVGFASVGDNGGVGGTGAGGGHLKLVDRSYWWRLMVGSAAVGTGNAPGGGGGGGGKTKDGGSGAYGEHPLLIRQVVAEQEIRGTITHSRQGDLWLRFGWM
jgi:hypothetical protein